MTTLMLRPLALGVVLCALIAMMGNYYPKSGSAASQGITELQDVRNLDRRVSLLEQRLYTIELSINQLQQASRSQPTPLIPPNVRDQEIDQLRIDVQALGLRIREMECGLVKLDERTMSAAVREARKNEGTKIADPCRINPGAPLRLSSRP